MTSTRLPRGRIACAMLLLFAGLSHNAQAQSLRIKDDTPADVRAYLETAIKIGQKAHAQHVDDAKKRVADAQKHLDEVRKLYRKVKAKESDVKAADTALQAAKDALTLVQKELPLALKPLTRLDRVGAIGTLPHGFGVSRILDGKSALVFPFIEKTPRDDGQLFTDTEEISKEFVPTASPLLLTGVDTGPFHEGEKIPATRTVYRVGESRKVDEQSVQSLMPTDLNTYLIVEGR